ncbi:pentatricopeptide repeat-containing protein At4g18520, chloroplastic [Malania oleifera]|uniref:pentatricopeptide repeat-containing protein At4g18520, chloroplastic n=1 Tax=Malania oleifera TaxID=397392 RepID=UPI0025ADD24F|nr:pentatricopeptide repeat-containing protein At4g18520, chloroplastic [Malania oleifera]XP_057958899.1 pentatricopeptide repeat-containing protein At4g18520, chloroplastic [Malania oleifera]XP_057958900.1 pentatricopeptide repeat-containing protein At4g18520, chloroplastic [Malania oleifera]
MLSRAPPSPHTMLSRPAFLFSTQPALSCKPMNRLKKRSHNYSPNPKKFPSFSSKNLFFKTRFSNFCNFSIPERNPDAKSINSLSTNLLDHPNELAFWLQSCYCIQDVRRIHAVVMKCLGVSLVFVCNNLISAYLRLGQLHEARKVFDQMPKSNVVSWTAILNGYLNFGYDDEAVKLFRNFIEKGYRANFKTFVCVLNLCSKRLDLELGKQVHACVIKGNWRNLIVDSATVYFYAECGELLDAFRVFHQMPQRDLVTWTTLIAACSQQGDGEGAFSMFLQMLSDGFFPNEFTVCSVLKSCGEEKALNFGRQLHAVIFKKILQDDVFVGSSLVDMYAKCGEIIDSRVVFDAMKWRNMVTWTSIIAGYARNGLGEEAISLFRVMKRQKICANSLTIVSILKACGLTGALLMGKEIHAQIVKKSNQSNIYIGTTLVWFYCKCEERHVASKVLQTMPLRDVVSWTAIISGCTHLGHEAEALEFLREMLDEGVEPNDFTYSSSLKACAKLEDILQGKSIHSSVNKTAASSNVFVGSALISMYGKCGYVSEAIQVFDHMLERDVVTWNAMISGYIRNGLFQEALRLIYQMQAEGFKVEDYILSTVLAACGDVSTTMDLSSYHCLPSC